MTKTSINQRYRRFSDFLDYCTVAEVVFGIDVDEALDRLFNEILPAFLDAVGDSLEQIGGFLLNNIGLFITTICEQINKNGRAIERYNLFF